MSVISWTHDSVSIQGLELLLGLTELKCRGSTIWQ
jgi:hypothetical protein